jgi:flagellar assembly protein FliH
MKWSRPIQINRPPKDVKLLANAPALNWEDLLRQCEAAAYAQGRRDGETALNEQLVRQRAELAELQTGVLMSLQNAIPEVVGATERAVIHLALESAQKIVAQLPIDVGLVEAVVREALEKVKDTAEVAVHLNPDDLALLRHTQSAVPAGTPEMSTIKFVAAPEVTRGGCLVQTRFGLIDARREGKWEHLTQSIGI